MDADTLHPNFSRTYVHTYSRLRRESDVLAKTCDLIVFISLMDQHSIPQFVSIRWILRPDKGEKSAFKLQKERDYIQLSHIMRIIKRGSKYKAGRYPTLLLRSFSSISIENVRTNEKMIVSRRRLSVHCECGGGM